MFIMKSIVMTGVWMAYFFEFLFNRRNEDRDYAVVYGIYMVISLLVVGLGLRFKKAMIPLIILSYPALETCHILIWRFIAEPLDQRSLECSKHYTNLQMFKTDFYFNVMFVCQSPIVLVFWYIPVYLVKYNVIMLRSDVDIYHRVFNCFMAIAMACIVFWVLHYRELGRFFQ